jgi:hypothetical protein
MKDLIFNNIKDKCKYRNFNGIDFYDCQEMSTSTLRADCCVENCPCVSMIENVILSFGRKEK